MVERTTIQMAKEMIKPSIKSAPGPSHPKLLLQNGYIGTWKTRVRVVSGSVNAKSIASPSDGFDD